MTIGGALSDLNNLLNADDMPCYYKPSIKAVIDTIALEQEPKTGHWIEHEQNEIAHIECSECLTWFLRCHLTRNSFCPNCGAKMIDPQESEEQE